MTKVLCIAAALLFVPIPSSAEGESNSGTLLWIGFDLGVVSGSMSAGLNCVAGFPLTEAFYIDFAAQALSPAPALCFLGLGIRYYPFSNGLVLGGDIGAGAQLQEVGNATWCPAGGVTVAYDFGFLVAGFKANLYLFGSSQTTYGIFLDFGGQAAAMMLVMMAAQQRSESQPDQAASIDVVIVGSFSGFAYQNQYELSNGEVWEQTDYYYYYRSLFRPRVHIWGHYGDYRMVVEGIDASVGVRRIR